MDTPIKPLVKTPNTIVRLDVLDAEGKIINASYQLSIGTNNFSCLATYIDGSSAPFEPYWTLPMQLPNGSGVDFFGALGNHKQAVITVNAASSHIRYPELACWVKLPDTPDTDAINYPNKHISLDYSKIV